MKGRERLGEWGPYCTGDADLAAWAGAEFLKGDEEDGALQPATLCFVMGNVDEYAYKHGVRLNGGNPSGPIHAVLASGRFPLLDAHICSTIHAPRTVGFNASHLHGVENTARESPTAFLTAS